MAQTAVRAAPVLSIDVGSQISIGGVVDAEVNIADAADLYAFQFDLAFNPAVVVAVSVTEGSFLASAGGTFFGPGTIDNLAGTISFICNTLIGLIAGGQWQRHPGDDQVFRSRPGTSVLSLSNVILLDSALGDIDATVRNGAVDVVPEPATLLLVSTGVAALVRRRNRPRRPVA